MTRDQFITDAKYFQKPNDVTGEHLEWYYKLFGYLDDDMRAKIIGKTACWCIGIRAEEEREVAYLKFQETGTARLPNGAEIYREPHEVRQRMKALIPDNMPVDECRAIIEDTLGVFIPESEQGEVPVEN